MTLSLYNTLTKKKEPFEPLVPGKVGMYTCGPTVYKPSHVGHMVGPVLFDTFKRYLEYLGYQVTWVLNITDVDDKLIVRARELNTTVKEVAESVTADYVENLHRLGVDGITHLPRVTDHIDDIVRLIQGLIERGFAYPSWGKSSSGGPWRWLFGGKQIGDVYFDVSRDKDYGKLCHIDPKKLSAGAQSTPGDRKRNPGDFALWKSARPGEPSWDSPWGPGRPGWHIECTAMSLRLLGETLDIHGGGLDLQFPHHENELAQSESYTGKPFVRHWMHNGLMKTGKQKMSKSKGNEAVVTEVLRRHQPETLRYLLLSSNYRRPIEYGEKRLGEVRGILDGFYRFFERYEHLTGEPFHAVKAPARHGPMEATGTFLTEVAGCRSRFLDHLDRNFDTAGAIGVLHGLKRALNRLADGTPREDGSAQNLEAFRRGVVVFKELSQILGLFRQLAILPMPGGLAEGVLRLQRELAPNATEVSTADHPIDSLIQPLMALRTEARGSGNFTLADRVRQSLADLGITLEDSPSGTRWRAAGPARGAVSPPHH